MALKDEIRDVINLLDDPEWQAMSARRKVQVASVEIAEAVCKVLRALSPDEIDDKAQELVEVGEMLFDEYLEPIDLPVGDFLEGFIDSALRRGIGPAVYAIIAALDR